MDTKRIYIHLFFVIMFAYTKEFYFHIQYGYCGFSYGLTGFEKGRCFKEEGGISG